MAVLTRLLAPMCVVMLASWPAVARAQAAASATPAAAPAEAGDNLGRESPRGTVIGFLNAARSGDDYLAAQYLDVKLPREAAESLARQLFVVLDARLSARLSLLNSAPGGSRANPLAPDQEIIGTISAAGGRVDVSLARVSRRGTSPAIWLFSKETLEAVPALYEEISRVSIDTFLPEFLTRTRVAGIRLFEWLSVLLGLPLLYLLTVLLNGLLTRVIAALWHRVRGAPNRSPRELLPVPLRLLLLAATMHWLAVRVQLPILARQFWLATASLVGIAAAVWLGLRLNGAIEQYVRRRSPRTAAAAVTSLLRLARRIADVLVVFTGVLVMLRRLGIDVTPALAGLGVSGIAVALAAQKTLENVIAGVSLIFDGAVSQGDFLKVGDAEGTVDHVGLRSTRIRTLDRTIVSVPNSQIANMSLETLSARDKFWFHPVVGLRYQTTARQLREVVTGIRRMLVANETVDPESVRVRFVRLGAFSLDVDVFAYIAAHDWNQFLEIQEQLLFSVIDVVQQAGTEVAFPSQTLYVSGAAQPTATGPTPLPLR